MQDDEEETVHYTGPSGGWGSLRGISQVFGTEWDGPSVLQTLRDQNKPGGFMCVSCAWTKPADHHVFEFCENGAKATLWELTSRRCTQEFFANHTISELRGWKDYDLVVSASMLEYVPRDLFVAALSGLRGLLNGNGRFVRSGYVSGAGSKRDGRGFVPADYRRTGTLDFFLVNNGQPWLYLENKAAIGRHWSIVQLKGKKQNSYGIGARIRITAGGRTQIREIHVGSGFLSSPPPEAHFGLGSADKIDKIEVRWPWTTEWQTIQGLDADKIVVIEEGGAATYRKIPRKFDILDGNDPH